MRNEWENQEMSKKKMVATQAISPHFFYFLRVLMVRDQNSNSGFFWCARGSWGV